MCAFSQLFFYRFPVHILTQRRSPFEQSLKPLISCASQTQGRLRVRKGQNTTETIYPNQNAIHFSHFILYKLCFVGHCVEVLRLRD